jgi:hypothetical protein
VTAVDLAPAVESALLRRLDAEHASVLIADSLEIDVEEPFDLVFDHTFFCAIDPSDRVRFGAMADRVLGSAGSVISIVFPIGRPAAEGGPPWGFVTQDLAAALGERFSLEEEGGHSRVAGRRWPYAWTRWTRA